ncbi:MAG: tetratricopeptide repeat protein [bacterium]
MLWWKVVSWTIALALLAPIVCHADDTSSNVTDPLNSATYLMWRGDQLLSNGDQNGAIDCYLLAASQLRNSPLPHFKLARAYLHTSLANALFEMALAVKILSGDFIFQSLILSNVVIILLIGLSVALYSGVLAITVRHMMTAFTSISNLRLKLINRLAPEVLLMAIIASILIILSTKSFIAILTWFVLIAIGLTWRYTTSGEKRVIIFFLIYLLSIKPALDLTTKISSTQHPRSPLRVISIAPAVNSVTLASILPDMQTDPSQRTLEDFIKGIYYLQSNQPEKAVTTFMEVSRRQKSDVAILNNLAVSLFRLGHYEESRQVMESAIELDPNEAVLHYNHAQVLNALLDFTNAEEEITKASTLDFPLIRGLLTSKGESGPIAITLKDKSLWANCLSLTSYPLKLTYHPIESGKSGTLILSLFIAGCLIVTYKSRPSAKCSICGLPVRRIYSRPKLSEMVCSSCKKISQDFPDHNGADVEYKRRRRSVARRKTIATMLFGLILPGSAHFLTGKRLKGFLLTFLFACLATLVISKGSVVKPLPNIGIRKSPNEFIAIIIVIYLIYAINMIITILRKSREESS